MLLQKHQAGRLAGRQAGRPRSASLAGRLAIINAAKVYCDLWSWF